MIVPMEPINPESPLPARVKLYTTPPKTPEAVQGRDTFQTPDYAVDLLVPFIPKHIKTIWECACGEGKITRRLQYYKYEVCSTDIRFSPQVGNEICNFITDPIPEWGINCIITNPPFSIKEMFIERAFQIGLPFAFLINADYNAMQIGWIKRGCEKIIPNRRIDFITPTGKQGKTSASQFHSMWLTYKFGLGRTETFVDLPIDWKKNRI